MSNPGNVIGGHKANINNPNTSDEAKQHSQEVLDKEYDGGNVVGTDNSDKNPNRVAGGLKATTNNPNIPEETKQAAEQKLKDMGA